ncbi:membrane protein [Sphaerisporangium rufum]|uniref:Membrane protein n=1 Tax=Sphaerisporangium rufum TaxID=1381558 RepID=A0A919V014_9ACTN|nr:ComEC/Rec2 family competence protein [Sphaerisporangium rufum]GII78314.1 membrane protein [Sphaerisporangium rufum]
MKGSEAPSAFAARLVPPALAAWGTALVLLGCPARTGVLTALTALVLMAAVAAMPRGRHLAPGRRPGRPERRGAGTGWSVGVPPGPGHGVPRRAGRSPALRAGRGVALGMLGCIAGAAAAVAFRVHAVTSGPVAELAQRRAAVVLEVTLTDDPRVLPGHRGLVRRDRIVVPAAAVLVTAGGRAYAVRAPLVVFASGDEWRGLLPSQRLRVHGRLAPPEPGELLAAVLLAAGAPERLSGPSPPQRVAATLRSGLRQAAGVLPPDERGLLPALVVGDLSLMEEQVRADLKTAGLSHLTAVSGANLAIVAGAVVALSRLAGLPLGLRAAGMIAAMMAFAVVARPSPSVLRALVMGSVAAIALGTGRSAAGLGALAATVLGLVLFDPGLAREYGFALSVFATGGILVLAPRWRDRLAGRLPRMVAEAIAVPCAAQAAVTPLLVVMAGQLEPVAVPANLLAGPAVAPATLLGFAAAVVAPFHLPAAQVLVRPAGYAVGWIIWVARQAAGLPAATLSWPGGPAGLLLLALIAATAWFVLRRRAWRLLACAMAAGLVLVLVLAGPVLRSWPPPGWLMVSCDVGQGDAHVLAAGAGRAVVVDTGPDVVAVDRCLRELGVREVPLLILTHPHFDHVGGLDGVFRDRRVGVVLTGPGTEPRQESARVHADLARRHVTPRVASPGTVWQIGPVRLTVLAPDAGLLPAGPGEGSVANNASVVIHASWAAGSVLLTGDVETEAQQALLARGLPPADILKVPHHGSARQDPGFLAATGARAALISVGAGNDYGHPAPLTLTRLRDLGIRVHRTDREGALAVIADHGHLAIVPRGPPG